MISTLAVCGCQSTSKRYETVPRPVHRDRAKSEQANARGLKLVEAGRTADAEEDFRAALEHDIYNAAAHNNLGLVLMEAGKHYEAAWEFQYAARLVPNAPEPRENLGLLYETLGRFDTAVEAYDDALRVAPNSARAMRYKGRVLAKSGADDKTLIVTLKDILNLPPDRRWDEWARGELVRLERPERTR